MITNGFLMIPRHALHSLVQQSAGPISHELAFLDLLNLAHFAKRLATVNVGRRRVTIGQGEVAASLKYLAHRWRWTAGRVRTFLASLVKRGDITLQVRCCTTIVCITDYEKKFAGAAAPEQATQGQPSLQEAGTMDAPASQHAPSTQKTRTTKRTTKRTTPNDTKNTVGKASEKAPEKGRKTAAEKLKTNGKTRSAKPVAGRGRKTPRKTTLKDLKKAGNCTTKRTTIRNNKNTYKEKERKGEDFLSEKREAHAPENTKKLPNVTGSGPEAPMVPPTLQMVADYCRHAGLDHVQPEAFVDYYEARGWMMGERPMRCWQAAVNMWEKRQIEFDNQNSIRHELKNQPSQRPGRQTDARHAAGKPEDAGAAGQDARPAPLERIWNLIGMVHQESEF